MFSNFSIAILLFFSQVTFVLAGSKSKPHRHQGPLQPYDGKHISYEITLAQNAKLEAGEPVNVHSIEGD